ncbi:hypothetical protein ACFVMC_32220 [Nocardia sp. NPDC127579]
MIRAAVAIVAVAAGFLLAPGVAAAAPSRTALQLQVAGVRQG